MYCVKKVHDDLYWVGGSDRRLEKRNRAVEAGTVDAYYVDAGLAAKFARIFEKPGRDEEDVRYIR